MSVFTLFVGGEGGYKLFSFRGQSLLPSDPFQVTFFYMNVVFTVNSSSMNNRSNNTLISYFKDCLFIYFIYYLLDTLHMPIETNHTQILTQQHLHS